MTTSTVMDYIAWARATFPEETLAQQGLHLWRETRELEASPASPDELADVFMMASLIRYRVRLEALRAGVDLEDAVAKKLEKNRRRTWVRTPEGDYQHVKDPEA